jgi:hypothetical protein
VDPTPNPSGAAGSGFGGIACLSATSCNAVGSTQLPGGPGEAFAETRG